MVEAHPCRLTAWTTEGVERSQARDARDWGFEGLPLVVVVGGGGDAASSGGSKSMSAHPTAAVLQQLPFGAGVSLRQPPPPRPRRRYPHPRPRTGPGVLPGVRAWGRFHSVDTCGMARGTVTGWVVINLLPDALGAELKKRADAVDILRQVLKAAGQPYRAAPPAELKKRADAADILRQVLEAAGQSRAQRALKKYRQKIITCQRYWRSYSIVTAARRQLLILAFKNMVKQIDAERLESYSARLREIYEFDGVGVEVLLNEMRKAKMTAQQLLWRRTGPPKEPSLLSPSASRARILAASDDASHCASTSVMGGASSIASSTLAGSRSIASHRHRQGNQHSEHQGMEDEKVAAEAALMARRGVKHRLVAAEAALMARRGVKHRLIPAALRNPLVDALLHAARVKHKTHVFSLLEKRMKASQVRERARRASAVVTMEDVRLALLSGVNGQAMSVAEARAQRVRREVAAMSSTTTGPAAALAHDGTLRMAPMLLLHAVTCYDIAAIVILAEREAACAALMCAAAAATATAAAAAAAAAAASASGGGGSSGGARGSSAGHRHSSNSSSSSSRSSSSAQRNAAAAALSPNRQQRSSIGASGLLLKGVKVTVLGTADGGAGSPTKMQDSGLIAMQELEGVFRIHRRPSQSEDAAIAELQGLIEMLQTQPAARAPPPIAPLPLTESSSAPQLPVVQVRASAAAGAAAAAAATVALAAGAAADAAPAAVAVAAAAAADATEVVVNYAAVFAAARGVVVSRISGDLL
ncbi:hypothetical protein JKP88DRAFT_328047 [Tribonema minus]|uniref:Uncharacterized protein n=1 Tax=Tribonema minus TaxID=303371 RepID=A0A836CCD8_9STRA|nr:hypothetical protein JKP88DRAFT_328047 [Tribonema minus]